MDLLMLHSLQSQQKYRRDFQEKLSKVTALLLVPTLIAGIFGANTMLPGKESWHGFFLMLTLMVVSATGIYAFEYLRLDGLPWHFTKDR